jgi:hypothetical protein
LWQDGPIEATLQRGEAALARGDGAAAEAMGREALDLLASCGLGGAIQVLAENVTNQGELGVLAAVNGKAVAAYRCLIARAEALAGTRRAAALLAAGNWPATLRVWVWSPGDVAVAGRPLALEVRALGPHPIRAVTVHYRLLSTSGDNGWKARACRHERGAVYRGAIPAADLSRDGLAYYVTAEDESGATATAPLGYPSVTWTTSVVGGTAFYSL